MFLWLFDVDVMEGYVGVRFLDGELNCGDFLRGERI